MTGKTEKKLIREYLADRLSYPGINLSLQENNIAGMDVSYITANEGLAIIVDKVFPGDSLRAVRGQFRAANWQNIAFAIYKDGKTFFRVGVKFKSYNRGKKTYDKSLKNYTDAEINHMIVFRPEEQLASEQGRGWVQYFQPNSQMLNQGIASFRFEPVRLDYSHLDGTGYYRPDDKNSERLRIWRERNDYDCKLKIENGFLLQR